MMRNSKKKSRADKPRGCSDDRKSKGACLYLSGLWPCGIGGNPPRAGHWGWGPRPVRTVWRSMIGRPVRCRTFIGRRTELATLHEARKSLVKSAGSFVLVSGEAGIGKTRLLAEFLDNARNRREISIVKTECLPGPQTPLGPVRSLLRELIRIVRIAEL